MALLGADNLGKNGKQNLNPDGTPNSLSRSTAFNYQSLGPGFHGVGGMSGDTPENLARARANEAAKVTPTVTPTLVPKPVAGPGAGYPGLTGLAPQPSRPFKKDAIDPVLSHADDATDAIANQIDHSFVNTARDIKKDPLGAIQSRAINSVLDIGNAIANTGANFSNAEFNTNLPNVSLPKIEGNVPTPDSIVRGVYDSVKRGDGVSAQFLPRVKGGSLERNVKKGTAWSGGLYVPGDGMTTFKRVADLAAVVPVVGKGAKLAAGVADRAIADSIVVNAAEKAPIETVTAAGRRPVRPGSKPPTGTGKKPPTINPDAGPVSRQLAEYAPKAEPANVQPVNMVTEHSRAFGDNPEANSRAMIDSLYTRAQSIAEEDGRQVFTANHVDSPTGRRSDTDIEHSAAAHWTDVYHNMIENKKLSPEEYPNPETFLHYLRRKSHIDTEANDGPVEPTLKAANDTFLELFHGKGASDKPIAYYRNSAHDISDGSLNSSGDWSLDRTMAYNYGSISRNKNKLRMDVTTDSLRHPVIPLYRHSTAFGGGEVRPDEMAQNWHDRGNDWGPGGIVEGISPKNMGKQLQDYYPWNDDQRFRETDPAIRYGIRDYEFVNGNKSIPQEIKDKFGITPEDIQNWNSLKDSHFKPVTDKTGELTGRGIVNKRASEFGIENPYKNTNPVGRPLSAADHALLRKISAAMHEAGIIKEPFHYNKFDVPQRRDGVQRGTVTGDPEGLYSTVTKKPNSVTVRQGKTKEAVSAEEKAAEDRQALLESTAPSQDLLDAHGAVEMKHGPEITHGTYDYPTDAVSRAGVFHGTANPEVPTIEQGQQEWNRNIAGGNLFTTDSASTAKSYTSGGTERINNLAPSTDRVYRINGAEGKKFLDLNSHGKTIAEQDPELFQAIHDEIAKINPADAEKFKVMDGGGGNTRAITKKHNANDNTSPIDDEEPNYYNEERINFFNVGSPYNGILRKHALERGYHGFTHDGGRLSGDGGHQVLAFWDTVGLTARRSNALERSAPSIDDIKGEISERKFRREREIERIRRSRQWTKEDQDRFG